MRGTTRRDAALSSAGTRAEPSLKVSVGHHSEKGIRDRNEDFVGMVTPNPRDLATKGMLAAIADGVSGNGGGREASEYTVR